MEVAVTLHTNGTGYWSNTAKAVRVVELHLSYVSEDREHGELCVHFDESWDVNKHGLIYTDDNFMDELNAFLIEQGLCAVYYSEQGMQGDDYVSCDVNEDFITAWAVKFGEEAVNELIY